VRPYAAIRTATSISQASATPPHDHQRDQDHTSPDPEALYTNLGISRAIFYKDCQVLKALGLAFHYDRQQRRHIIIQDRYLPILDHSTSEMLALIMAVRQLASTGDHTLTYEAIAALRKVVSNTPIEIRAFLQASLDDIVL